MPLPIQLVYKLTRTCNLEVSVHTGTTGRIFKKPYEYTLYVVPRIMHIHCSAEIYSHGSSQTFNLYSGNIHMVTEEEEYTAYTDDNFPKSYTSTKTVNHFKLNISQHQVISRNMLNLLEQLDQQGWNIVEPANDFLLFSRQDVKGLGYHSIYESLIIQEEWLGPYPVWSGTKQYTLVSK